MTEITKAIKAKQEPITQLQSDIGILQRAAGIVGGSTKAPAKRKAKPQLKSKSKPMPKAKVTPRPKAKAKKRHQWTAAEKAAIGKRMKAFWAKRRKPTAATTTAPAQPKGTQKRTRATSPAGIRRFDGRNHRRSTNPA